jgi:hypothetical protein
MAGAESLNTPLEVEHGPWRPASIDEMNSIHIPPDLYIVYRGVAEIGKKLRVADALIPKHEKSKADLPGADPRALALREALRAQEKQAQEEFVGPDLKMVA